MTAPMLYLVRGQKVQIATTRSVKYRTCNPLDVSFETLVEYFQKKIETVPGFTAEKPPGAHAWVPCTVLRGRRFGINVTECHFAVADIDGVPQQVFEDLLRSLALSGYEHAYHSTWSHKPENDSYCVRIVFPLTKPVRRSQQELAQCDEMFAAYREKALRSNNAKPGQAPFADFAALKAFQRTLVPSNDPATEDPSRAFYLPICAERRMHVYFSAHVQGYRRIDTDEAIAIGREILARTPSPRTPSGSEPSRAKRPASDSRRLTREVLEAVYEALPPDRDGDERGRIGRVLAGEPYTTKTNGNTTRYALARTVAERAPALDEPEQLAQEVDSLFRPSFEARAALNLGHTSVDEALQNLTELLIKALDEITPYDFAADLPPEIFDAMDSASNPTPPPAATPALDTLAEERRILGPLGPIVDDKYGKPNEKAATNYVILCYRLFRQRLKFCTFSEQPMFDGKPLDDATLHSIVLELQTRFKFNPRENLTYKGLVHLSKNFPYNPVEDDIRREKWDGLPRFSEILNSFGVEDPNPGEISYIYLERWLAGAVGRALKPRSKMDIVLTLQGAEGENKSTTAKVLGGEYGGEITCNMQNEDFGLNLRNLWIAELPEMSSLRRADHERVKATITNEVDRYRIRFDKFFTAHARRCAFMGTTNKEIFIHPDMGERRYWIIPVTKALDVKWFTANRPQILAEALAAYERGVLPMLVTETEKRMHAMRVSQFTSQPDEALLYRLQDIIQQIEKAGQHITKQNILRVERAPSYGSSIDWECPTPAEPYHGYLNKVGIALKKLGYVYGPRISLHGEARVQTYIKKGK